MATVGMPVGVSRASGENLLVYELMQCMRQHVVNETEQSNERL
jgi:hypothetical protein